MSVLCALGLGLLLRGPAQMPYQTVQPWTYRSPSGAVELFVDPTQRSGAGPARCRLTRDGELEWERELPFTLLDALVEEDGSAAGYAYPEGFTARDGTLVGRARLPADLRATAYLYFSPSGELWVFPHYRAELWRFAVPR